MLSGGFQGCFHEPSPFFVSFTESFIRLTFKLAPSWLQTLALHLPSAPGMTVSKASISAACLLPAKLHGLGPLRYSLVLRLNDTCSLAHSYSTCYFAVQNILGTKSPKDTHCWDPPVPQEFSSNNRILLLTSFIHSTSTSDIYQVGNSYPVTAQLSQCLIHTRRKLIRNLGNKSSLSLFTRPLSPCRGNLFSGFSRCALLLCVFSNSFFRRPGTWKASPGDPPSGERWLAHLCHPTNDNPFLRSMFALLQAMIENFKEQESAKTF